MTESILNSIKKDLGLGFDYEAFDSDILMFINGVFSTLVQLGLESLKGKFLVDSSANWDDFFEEDKYLINLVHPYVYIKVKELFDPPTSSFVLDNLKKKSDEYEWRIYIYLQNKDAF